MSPASHSPRTRPPGRSRRSLPTPSDSFAHQEAASSCLPGTSRFRSNFRSIGYPPLSAQDPDEKHIRRGRLSVHPQVFLYKIIFRLRAHRCGATRPTPPSFDTLRTRPVRHKEGRFVIPSGDVGRRFTGIYGKTPPPVSGLGAAIRARWKGLKQSLEKMLLRLPTS